MKCTGCEVEEAVWVNPNYPEALCLTCKEMRKEDEARPREIILDNPYDACHWKG